MKLTLLFLLIISISNFSLKKTNNQIKTDTNVLIGKWHIDLSPQNTMDDNFAMMEITAINGNNLKGTFYREGVKIKDGQLNTQTGTIHAALTSSDASGTYNTAFYFKDGILYGTTHSLARNFLSVWTATKSK